MPEGRTQILDGNRLQEYLRNEVRGGLLHCHLQLGENTEFYIVSLLLNFERTDRLFVHSDHNHMEEEPLAMMLARAIDGDTATQIRELKRLGDVALYSAGFFAEHIKRGVISVAYYVDMGSSAYWLLSNQLACEKVFAEIYKELADNFSGITKVLAGLTIADHACSNAGLLYLYERWRATGDEKIREALIKEGLIPTDKKISC